MVPQVLKILLLLRLNFLTPGFSSAGAFCTAAVGVVVVLVSRKLNRCYRAVGLNLF